MNEYNKPVIGFSIGDLNGIGIEVLIKTLADGRLLDLCLPVVFGSNKCINFYRKGFPEINFQYHITREIGKLNPKMVNVYNCWEEEVVITPGVLNETGGRYARLSLETATEALKRGEIDSLVTLPIHKKNIQSEAFDFTGHTPYLKAFFEAKEVAMLMVSEDMRVALLTEHVPLSEVAQYVKKEAIIAKLKIIRNSLKKDFGIDKPKIAVLSLNPHAGDDGLIGTEETTEILPAIEAMRKDGLLVFGPYPADGFFARMQHRQVDVVLAMYHDQGLIPFKSLSLNEGVNYTAGLPVVRTSPDHGTAFDIAGQGLANHESTLAAVFRAIDILAMREQMAEMNSNPLQKRSQRFINSVDEKIEEE